MKRIDGSAGEGGGQILRTSLSLAMVTGTPFEMTGIRAGRSKPGLLRQHLAAVRAATAVCGATVDGAELGSTKLVFTPGKIQAGDHAFAVGSAGSATLVLQTILPALIRARGVSNVTIEGGTHNSAAPPADFLARTFLPQLAKLGAGVELVTERAGFYPSGGGKLRARISGDAVFREFTLVERGTLEAVTARAIVVGLPSNIGHRECDVLREKLKLDRNQVTLDAETNAMGPGNVVMVEVRSAHVTEVFTSFGERGVPAETVAARAAEEALGYLASEVPVGAHLADQLLLVLALGKGGTFVTGPLSGHATTQIALLRDWLSTEIQVTEEGPGRRVTVSA